jgi:hypothetical protein
MPSRSSAVHRKGVVVFGIAGVLCLAASAWNPARADGEIELAALRLAALQADVEPGDNAGNGPDLIDLDPEDGGWDWFITTGTTEHSASPSPTNTYGITAMGAIRAFVRGTPDPRFFRTALIAEQAMDAAGHDRNPDFAFRVFLSKLSADPTYAETARALWIAKMGSFGGAQAYGEYVRDVRESQGIGAIYPWDVMWAVVSGFFLEKRFPGEGFRSDALALAFVIFADTQGVDPVFDIGDPTQSYHTIGLTGLIISFRLMRQYDAVRAQAYDALLATQNLDGGFNWNATYTDSDPQVTAYAVLAASLLKGDPRSLPAARAGSNWLATLQKPNGGFELYPPSGDEVTEVDSEILLAFSFIPPTDSLAGSPPSRWTQRPPGRAVVFED